MAINMLVRGNLFEMFLLHKLYKIDTSDPRDDGKGPEPSIRRFKTRKPFFLPKKFCHCLRSKKEKQLFEKGLERTLRELEIDHFIRTQKYVKLMMSTLFTSVERHLLRHQKTFMLNSQSSEAPESSDDRRSDECFELLDQGK